MSDISPKIEPAKLRTRISTASEWTSVNPILELGEIGIESDTFNMKVGNGSSAWNSLGYYGMTPVGTILPYGGSTAPPGYAICDGSAISRTIYAALFAAIGTSWGVGDGATTFNIPDLRGAFLRGTGSHGSETKADGNAYSGPSVGSSEDDQMQQIRYPIQRDGETTNITQSGDSGTAARTVLDKQATDYAILYAQNAVSHNFGTPRTGDETRPFNFGVNYIIKV